MISLNCKDAYDKLKAREASEKKVTDEWIKEQSAANKERMKQMSEQTMAAGKAMADAMGKIRNLSQSF